MGLQTRDFLRIIIEQANVPVVVDAGIGVPSHAAEAMEMGASAVFVITSYSIHYTKLYEPMRRGNLQQICATCCARYSRRRTRKF